jgi:hypothetical protein
MTRMHGPTRVTLKNLQASRRHPSKVVPLVFPASSDEPVKPNRETNCVIRFQTYRTQKQRI